MTDTHEMRRFASTIRAVYIDGDGTEYLIVDGERETLSSADDTPRCIVCGGDDCGSTWCRGSGD